MKTAVVICPGRGTYNASELGYLRRFFPDPQLMARFEHERSALGQEALADLDGATSFTASRHSRGDNASSLIFAATYGDFLAIDREKIEIVAVTGNSMGWYSALACAGAVAPLDGFKLANTMGGLMQKALIGGQLIYPWVDEHWVAQTQRKADLLALIDAIGAETGQALHLSIDLGGMLVVAGDAAGLKAFEAAVTPTQGRFPLRLAQHAAFHTPLQRPVAAAGRQAIASAGFGQPALPLIDGRGTIWWPGASDATALWDYTLGEQVTSPYNFTRAMLVAAREFAPDYFIVTGPGTTLGGACAQALILAQYRDMASKADFQAEQQRAAFLLAMGLPEQRRLVV